jgi:hypothetical protein
MTLIPREGVVISRPIDEFQPKTRIPSDSGNVHLFGRYKVSFPFSRVSPGASEKYVSLDM